MSEFPQAAQLGNLVLSLALIIGLIIASLWLIKKLSGMSQAASGNKLRVLASLSLGARERALIVQAGETQILLGVAPGRVSQLHVFEEPVFDESDAKTGSEFAAQLANLLPQKNATN